MIETGQLNIFSYTNRRTQHVQSVPLYRCEELTAEMLVLPPGQTAELGAHPTCNEVYDVVEGAGHFTVAGRSFVGTPGKCVLVAAGVERMLYNDGDVPWVLRVTTQERMRVRGIGRLLARALRHKFGWA